jgi:hypothetical protein
MLNTDFNFKALLKGALLVFLGAAIIFILGLLWGDATAYNATSTGANQEQALEQAARLFGSTRFLLLALAIGLLFTTLGGFVSARRARATNLKQAAPVGFLSLLIVVVLFKIIVPMSAPWWFLPVSLLLPVPLALAGGYLATLNWTFLKGDQRKSWYAGDGYVNLRSEERIEHDRTVAEYYARLLAQRKHQRELEKQSSANEHEARRRIEEESFEAAERLRALAHTAFMSHPAATEDDFARCWPEIRDEIFKQHTLRVLAASPPQIDELLAKTEEEVSAPL